jgi:hypothetical protein
MGVKKESDIEAELVMRVTLAGGMAKKVTVIGTRGFFDRLVILPGPRVIFVELKRPKGGRVSPHQKQWHARCRSLGVEVALVKRSEDIDRLLAS